MIRIASVETVTAARPGRDARRAWTERRSLLVTLDGGGVGEAAPLPGYSPDTLEACRDALAALPPLDGPADVARLPDALPAARFALETAILARGGGLAAHLGVAPRAVARCRLVADVAEADAAVADGAAALKVKIGVPGDRDLLAALRGRFGAIPLRLDANGALAAAELDAYVRFRPELVEEPIADPRQLPPLPFPVALDESLLRLAAADVARLARAGRIQALVLKPMILGGAMRCLELARWAAGLGLATCASHLHDGPIARAATRALAEALPGRVLPCGV
ncbi:MAG TPA: enolase C-terminal domain-like protein [Haliangiales bacterium]|nr:enolase C-terminal domain-like protein [Haliangiales bacterium]